MNDAIVDSFLRAALVPRDASHASGTVAQADEILSARPDIAESSIFAAAVLGDDDALQGFLLSNPGLAAIKGGPYEWDALTHLCFSRYLRLDKTRSDGFVRAAHALLDAGASANTGFFEANHQPEPEWEGVLYGAAGIAHHAPLTRLLLEHGADPTDGEVVYHTPETYDNDALRLIVATGRLSDDDLTLMLARKHDWHDYDGVEWLLQHGAKPNHVCSHGLAALHHALRRDNHIEIIRLLLDHGADSTLQVQGRSAVQVAAWCGRADALDLFEQRGFRFRLMGVDQLVAACARADDHAIRKIIASGPELLEALLEHEGELLREFVGTGNMEGVRRLLDLGVAVDAPVGSDGYWGIPDASTALHVAAWRLRHDLVKLLIRRGADVHLRDGNGQTPLMLAVRGCVASYWTEMRSPESVDALLMAGAAADAPYPSGYPEVDVLLARAEGS